jgi:hypothetical protein
MTKHTGLAFAFALALGACGNSTPPIEEADAPVNGGGARLPTWILEDIQPESPRVGQTYGLDVYAGSVVVVTLVEGF